ncbi:MAG TPA: hypothetical protein VNO69_05780 [Methyloceanibacter sp.]|nr:hypothetical protein [Methyloceanibacter sp.]
MSHRLAAATREGMSKNFPPKKGDGAPKDAVRKWFVPCGTRAPLGAPHALK